MLYSAEIAEAEEGTRLRRRRYSRYPLRSLSYVKLDSGNGGIIRDLTESGIAIQAVGRLRAGTDVKVSFDLLSPRVRVEAMARVAWADESGQAGLQFDALPLRMQRALRDWLLTQMFSAAAISGRDSIFHALEPQLITSAEARPAIAMPLPAEDSAELPRVAWGLISFSENTIARLIDGVVLVCAVLLFSVCSLAVMGSLPAWPLATTLFVTVFLIFAAAYQLIFSELLCGATPGQRLASLALLRTGQDDAVQRFR